MLTASETTFAFQPEHTTIITALPWGMFSFVFNIRHRLTLHLWSDTPMGLQFRPRFSIHEPLGSPIWCVPEWAWVLPMGVFLALQPIAFIHDSPKKVGFTRRLYWISNPKHDLRMLQIWLRTISKEAEQDSWRQRWLNLFAKGGA